MAFKAFITRITSSFKFCCSKNQSNMPENPIQLSPSPLFIDCQLATPLPFKKPHRSSFKHHVSSFLGCGFRTHDDDLPESPPCKWDETPCRDYNSSISSDSDDELFPPPPPPTRHPITTSIFGNSDNELFPPPPFPPTPTRRPIATSSANSGLCGYERDDEEEEIVTLATFSLNHKKRVKKLLPSFSAKEKVKDSFAVVKESVDPYEDFKASMIEMILAKQLFEERDFEQLLECFLSLNSRHHYGVIVDAFSDIWKTIFLGQGPSPRSNHVAALYGDKMLLIFGGASKSKTLNDIYSLDFETMIWPRIKIRGFHPSPRAGCCGVLRGTKWYIAGGGSRKKRHTKMLIFDVLKQEWSVSVASPPSSITTNKGFSLLPMQHKKRDFLVVFGGSKKEPSNQIEVLTMEKNELSIGQRLAPSKGPGSLLSENRLSSTGLATQLSTGSFNGSVDAVAKQNLASIIEHHGSGGRSLSESLLVDSNPVSGNISLRKKFHDEEDSMMAKSSEDGSPSQVAEQRTKQLDMGVQANITGNKVNSEETSLFESDGSNTHNKGNGNLPTDNDDIVVLLETDGKSGGPSVPSSIYQLYGTKMAALIKKNGILEGQLAVALASREAAEKNLSFVLKSRQEMEIKTDRCGQGDGIAEREAGWS
ncbi:Acyl-CoA-binding domain-containing protein 6 [Camellia lanceoleosa]|uniref:Acyl-CoA-binding domain-containing protein 6 n=1 Tax=Camellia lanceoleosa TaxID=1840588 RepID=A0ACC0HG72_9ERIC|nr:Acyl-CoA-binding domain-containing protein 6 [Camellia lanceoleosa]